MQIRSRRDAEPFTTADGSTIRVLFGTGDSARAQTDEASARTDEGSTPANREPDRAHVGGARNQSLAEAVLGPGEATQRHYHGESEEIYYLLEGTGEMEVDGARSRVGPGDAVLIPPRAWHQIRADGAEGLRFLCACAPAYRHDDTFFE